MLSSTSTNARPDRLSVGLVTGAHGLYGDLRVLPLTDDPERFFELTHCEPVRDGVSFGERRVLHAKLHGKFVLLRLDGVADRDAALALRDAYLTIGREQAIPLGPDRWFICDLIGCDVVDQTLGSLGTLVNVEQNAANDVYVVRKSGEKDLLIPALKTILQMVDLEARRIIVSLPDGLYEVYR